ncbi:hypothetical protein JP34_00910 [Gallibacterium anatis]|uniref:hypothetical protein n=1 Tax=Gallibacterium anatis TaxID=750 RepID=UPI0005320618|nr:hypothetical protein [Gallibacterium anatis]KGQ36079.1 hypothetical protein JP34_00910 [Gallibacterium anatis]
MKTLIYTMLLAVLGIATHANAVVIASSTAATTAAIANNHNKQKDTDKHRKQQEAVVTQIAQTGGLTVDADSGHVIIRCQRKEGGFCVIPGGKESGKWYKHNEDLIMTPKEFAERQGYSKLYRITLLPLYDKDWLALDVSK